MVKSYIQLNNEEKELVYNFINRNEEKKKTIEEVEKELKSEVYNSGEGSLFYIKDKRILGKALVVLEVAEVMKTTYIHSLDIILEESAKNVFNELIKYGVKVSESYEVKKILLGVRNDNILRIAEESNLYSNYSAYNMILEDKEIKYDLLELVQLDSDNINQYIDIYNRSFMDMPHGTYIDFYEVDEYLKNANSNNEYFMVVDGEEIIGFMNTDIKEDDGFFDIGLSEEFRGRGNGKRLLETAINYLKEKGIKNICLTVIESNKIAFNMYQRRGFKILNNLSKWIEVK